MIPEPERPGDLAARLQALKRECGFCGGAGVVMAHTEAFERLPQPVTKPCYACQRLDAAVEIGRAEARATITALRERATVGMCAMCGLAVRQFDGIIEDERGLLHLTCAQAATITALTQANQTLRTRAIVAEQHRTLELLSKGSAVEQLEKDLRIKLAEAEIEVAAQRVRLAQLQELVATWLADANRKGGQTTGLTSQRVLENCAYALKDALK